MSLITIDRTLVSNEQGADTSCSIEEGSENALETASKSSYSEDFFVCKSSALTIKIKSQRRISVVRDHDNLHEHLKKILQILRFNDYVKLIVKLENATFRQGWFRYLAIISAIGSQNTEESVVLGVDVYNGAVSIGFTLPIFQDMVVTLDGDGGFKLLTKDVTRLFKPISVQALWAAHQAILQCCRVAHQNDYHFKGVSHSWVAYYADLRSSEQFMMVEWNKMEDVEDFGRSSPSSGDAGRSISEEEWEKGEEFKNAIRLNLQKIMGRVDLEDVNVVQLREMLEDEMKMSLKEQRHFIADQVLIIYGQMDAPTFVFDHLLLGSSFNASNGDELRRNRVTHIVNVTREVDNFFPADQFVYKNIRVFDDERAQLLPYWDETFRFINEARANGTRCLVHCKMGISRSGSTVVAYVMKEKGWKLDEALEFVKSKRPCVNPNSNFIQQLKTYQGILEASSHRHSALFRQNEATAAGVAGASGHPRSDTAAAVDVAQCGGEEEGDFGAFEPPPGPSGPIDLEAELFAFKSPHLKHTKEELVENHQLPMVVDDCVGDVSAAGGLGADAKVLHRRVLATTSQRIRHWHPGIYEDVGSSTPVISTVARSKSSPTRVFPHHGLHQQATSSSAATANFAVPLITSVVSPLHTSTTTVAAAAGNAVEPPVPRPPPSPTPSCGSTSSVSEHDVLMLPSSLLRPSPAAPTGESEKRRQPQPQRTRPVTINIVPTSRSDSHSSGFSVPSDHRLLPASFSNGHRHRQAVSMFTMTIPGELGEESPQHSMKRPTRTLSLRLRPDDSWIVKPQSGDEPDDTDKKASLNRPGASMTSRTVAEETEDEDEEEEEEGRFGREVVVVGREAVSASFRNSLTAIVAATQH